MGYREGDIENCKGPQMQNLIIIQVNLTVNKMKTKLQKIKIHAAGQYLLKNHFFSQFF